MVLLKKMGLSSRTSLRAPVVTQLPCQLHSLHIMELSTQKSHACGIYAVSFAWELACVSWHTACMLVAMLTISACNLTSSMHVPVRSQKYAAETAGLA